MLLNSSLRGPSAEPHMPLMEEADRDVLMGDSGEQSDEPLGSNGFVDPSILMREDGSGIERDSSQDSEESEPPLTPDASLVRKSFLPTGCCYDDRMKFHANADFSNSPSHPEDPRRIAAIMDEFIRAGLIFSGPNSELEQLLKHSPTSYMYRIAARPALESEISTVHYANHYHWVESLSRKTSDELREMTARMDLGRKSLYVGNLTFEAALVSAGGAIETCKSVVAGIVKNGIAVIRPPGHHAEAKEAMGFCIFNNVPIAARVCQTDFPETCRKVLILDWDVHHGNGIQNMFYEDPNVLYISLHVYQDGMFYPGAPEDPDLADGGLESCGEGIGIGKNINIGWHDQHMGNGEYLAAFQKIVMPIAWEFDPDLVIVSAGFDAADGDELGGCHVTPACYAHMTHMLMSLANGKVAVCLEGGYNLRAISKSALAVAKTLMGEPPQRITIPPVNRMAAIVLNKVMEIQAPYWECMRPGRVAPIEIQQPDTVKMDEMVRAYQRDVLRTKHKMINLYVQKEKLTQAFADQVLVTQGLPFAKRIMVIVHDPPEILGLPDLITNKLDSNNAWMTDGILPYIDWAVQNGFGVMDINMPFAKKPDEVRSGYEDRPSTDEQQERCKELVCYLWDNYLDMYECDNIVLMGAGDAYHGVKMLLSSRDIKSRISCVINFVTGTLRQIKSEIDPELSAWYRTHSRVYVSGDHSCWSNPEYEAKLTKTKSRFGKVSRSSQNKLEDMLRTHIGEAREWIGDAVGLDDTESEEQLEEDRK